MADKKFIGNTKAGKYPDQIEIGLQQKDIDLLQSSLNEKGWVNVRVNKGKESGKPYAEIVTAQATGQVTAQVKATVIDTKDDGGLPF